MLSLLKGTLTLTAMIVAQSAFATSIIPQSAPVENYEKTKALLGLEKDGDVSRTYHGIVIVDADNEHGKRSRYTCMALKFMADDKNERLNYMYKGWNTGDPESPCNFRSVEKARIGQHILCMNEAYDNKDDRYIDLEDVSKAHDGRDNWRGIEMSKEKKAIAEAAFGTQNPAGMALTRCNPKNRREPLPEGMEPKPVAAINSMDIVYQGVKGSAAQGPQRTLQIQLDLSKVNPDFPEFKKVNYVIMLDERVEDIKASIANAQFSGLYDVNYVQPGATGFSYNGEDLMETHPDYKHLGPQFRGEMDINFVQNEKTGNKLAYTFSRRSEATGNHLLPAGETDDKSCTGGESTLPRSPLFREEMVAAIGAIEAGLVTGKEAEKLPVLKQLLEGLDGLQGDAKLAEKPLGFIMAKKCLNGGVEKDLQVPIMSFNLSEDNQTLEMRAFLGQFKQQPIMGFSHYLQERQ